MGWWRRKLGIREPGASPKTPGKYRGSFKLVGGGFDLSLIEFEGDMGRKTVELRLEQPADATPVTRTIEEFVSGYPSACIVRDCAVVSTGRHVFVCRNHQIVFEGKVDSEIYHALFDGDVVVLATELDAYTIDRAKEPLALVHRLSTPGGIIEEVRIVGDDIEVKGEYGHTVTAKLRPSQSE